MPIGLELSEDGVSAGGYAGGSLEGAPAGGADMLADETVSGWAGFEPVGEAAGLCELGWACVVPGWVG